ncbi:hypothetical protein NEF87_000730 [Candidatus Lokiarchaeum ossiferum]|uniref:Roadblock/LAMTOR2 domain-containing protein n=1 Tax=Candidatus Lokiarchaeum ossiferum TaxID=2951803 RepID=A0ABY6HLQ5_9ARCH|nr:hypothetical protein NEF87_000730 [Candidatus Lokiarchaeum sp. B-35]
MTQQTSATTEEINWKSVVQQIFDMIGTNTAIINKYGIILASKIQKFQKGKLISPRLWDLILQRDKVGDELGVKSISSLVLESEDANIIITFAKHVYLMSYVSKDVDLAQYMPSITRISSTLDRSTNNPISFKIENLDLHEEFLELTHENQDQINEDRFPIFKHLIKNLAKK